MPSFNHITLIGNLTRDPEIRYIGSGAAVVKFTLAVNRRSKDQEQTDYIDCVAWDKLAETVNTYLRKGSTCLVDGRLSIRSYDDKDGNKRKATEVVFNRMQLLDKAPARASGAESHAATGGGDGGSHDGGSYGGGDDEPFRDDEIPF